MESSTATRGANLFFKRLKAAIPEITIWGLTFDALVLVGIIAALNTHLILGLSCRSLIFIPERFLAGEWHRLLTHPFVHLSWYHFVLDAGAFLLLYTGLEEKQAVKRVMYAAGCGFGGLVAAWGFAPMIRELGLCGLSGTAHGLMAVSALEMMRRRSTFKVGLGCLALVTVKSVYEAMAGKVVFAFLHFGLCGTPLAICHLGGVVGGVVIFSGIGIYHLLCSRNA